MRVPPCFGVCALGVPCVWVRLFSQEEKEKEEEKPSKKRKAEDGKDGDAKKVTLKPFPLELPGSSMSCMWCRLCMI